MVEVDAATNPVPLWLEVFDDVPYAGTGDDVAFSTTALGAWNLSDPTVRGTQNLVDATTNGQYLYTAAGTDGVHRLDTAGTWTIPMPPGPPGSWSGPRTGSSSVATTPSTRWSPLARSQRPSARSRPGGRSPRSSRPASSSWRQHAMRARTVRIYAYGLNAGRSALEPKTSTPMPRGEKATSGIHYLGRTFIGGGRITSDGGFSRSSTRPSWTPTATSP